MPRALAVARAPIRAVSAEAAAFAHRRPVARHRGCCCPARRLRAPATSGILWLQGPARRAVGSCARTWRPEFGRSSKKRRLDEGHAAGSVKTSSFAPISVSTTAMRVTDALSVPGTARISGLWRCVPSWRQGGEGCGARRFAAELDCRSSRMSSWWSGGQLPPADNHLSPKLAAKRTAGGLSVMLAAATHVPAAAIGAAERFGAKPHQFRR